MGLWVDSIVKLSNIPFIYNQGNISFVSFKSMIYATCCLIMFILSQMTITFSDFPVNIWVASFIV